MLKRGPMGCIVYEGAISDDLEDGIVGKGFPIEVYNVLGAGDAFMSGFLRGWLKGRAARDVGHLGQCLWCVCRLAAALRSGNPDVDRTAVLPRKRQQGEARLRKDEAINHVHWATTRRREIPQLMALAIDHRSQLEDLAGRRCQTLLARIPAFKVLAVKAAERIADGRPGFGMLIDDKYGRDALFAVNKNFWIGKPIELPGSRPLQFEFSQDLGSRLIDWPVDHCIKVLSFYHPDDQAEMKATQIAKFFPEPGIAFSSWELRPLPLTAPLI